jgi:hypothetical protein
MVIVAIIFVLCLVYQIKVSHYHPWPMTFYSDFPQLLHELNFCIIPLQPIYTGEPPWLSSFWAELYQSTVSVNSTFTSHSYGSLPIKQMLTMNHTSLASVPTTVREEKRKGGGCIRSGEVVLAERQFVTGRSALTRRGCARVACRGRAGGARALCRLRSPSAIICALFWSTRRNKTAGVGGGAMGWSRQEYDNQASACLLGRLRLCCRYASP